MEKEVVAKYQEGQLLLKNKKYQPALASFKDVYKNQPAFLSVCYFLGKCYYYLDQMQPAETYLKKHLASSYPKNQAQAAKLLCQVYLKGNNYPAAKTMFEQARQLGAKNLTKLKQALTPTLQFKFIQLAKNNTPIAKCNASEYQGIKFFINKMDDDKKRAFMDGKWHKLAVTRPKPAKFKGFMSVAVLDERNYYQKYLKKLPSLYYQSAFNDYLENDRFFKDKWEKSRVFSLLATRIFKREQIFELLKLNDLLDADAQKQLKSCDDLVYLKQQGEVLPLRAEKIFENPQQLRKFGFLCAKNCHQTLHLKDKCQGERLIKKILQTSSKQELPFKHTQRSYQPTPEQQAFIKWLKQNNRRVINLLGVGGSGKTYTLGQILNQKRVLALAPTHKARLNLAANGFSHNETLQKVLYELANSQSELLDGDKYDLIIIDEISMATQAMIVELFKYIGFDYRFLFLGDDRQLPPVSQDEDALEVCGNVMELLHLYGSCYCFTDNLRCKDAATSALIAQCRKQNAAYVKTTPTFVTQSGQQMLEDKLNHPDLEDCMILAYRNLTVGKINELFFKKLSKNKRKVIPFELTNIYGRGGFFIGAQVVFYRNDDQYQNYGYTNSEFGVITAIEMPSEKKPDGKIFVKTDVKEYALPVWRAKEDLFLAYALTIHKSQGSGSKRVYVVEANDYCQAYTALSRSKEKVYFVSMTRNELIKAILTPTKFKYNVLSYK
ncbi:exodeoxyribonuclease V alpha subunit [Ligilactobacillus sp. WC1T17]|uniref:Exodeoxyribonuclease V alpha subunit n=1 Tax=Ligilactobacillus ruminis TaxID=1623 RepID=A0ABY1ACB0_9LACO|nr:exodeoxyribonuclease V alpha subunit [Ligilactobacillus ruminis]